MNEETPFWWAYSSIQQQAPACDSHWHSLNVVRFDTATAPLCAVSVVRNLKLCARVGSSVALRLQPVDSGRDSDSESAQLATQNPQHRGAWFKSILPRQTEAGWRFLLVNIARG